jgi:hypothetical protein
MLKVSRHSSKFALKKDFIFDMRLLGTFNVVWDSFIKETVAEAFYNRIWRIRRVRQEFLAIADDEDNLQTVDGRTFIWA